MPFIFCNQFQLSALTQNTVKEEGNVDLLLRQSAV